MKLGLTSSGSGGLLRELRAAIIWLLARPENADGNGPAGTSAYGGCIMSAIKSPGVLALTMLSCLSAGVVLSCAVGVRPT